MVPCCRRADRREWSNKTRHHDLQKSTLTVFSFSIPSGRFLPPITAPAADLETWQAVEHRSTINARANCPPSAGANRLNFDELSQPVTNTNLAGSSRAWQNSLPKTLPVPTLFGMASAPHDAHELPEHTAQAIAILETETSASWSSIPNLNSFTLPAGVWSGDVHRSGTL